MNDMPARPKVRRVLRALSGVMAFVLASPALAQPAVPAVDPVRVLVKRLVLER